MYRVGVVSLGCAKNRVDTEMMLGILQRNGYELTTDESQADVLIVNTCGFINSAKEESVDTLLSCAEYKKTGRLKLLVATGCLAQRYEKDLMTEIPELDLLMGVNQYEQLPKAIGEALSGKRASYCADDLHILSGERVLTTPPYMAYIRVADGCDNRCAYCAIPLIRGGFRSRPMDDVLAEIKTLAQSGVKEHVLVAQDTSRYGADTHGRSLLPELLEKAAAIPGVEWLRVLYCYPDEVDDRLLDVMASHANICKYIDLPLQHADPALLKQMNRRGDPERTRAFLQKARSMGFTLRTTFIVGFPGETEQQFQRLMDFAREVEFDRMGAFAFSPEEDTPAAAMPDQVPEAVKQQRLDALMTLQQSLSLHRNQLRVGQTERALVESVRDDGVAVARTASEAPDSDGLLYLKNAQNVKPGDFVTARITDADIYDLMGVIV
ncbi:MAG TPA: 30S ribosomal protein S12 methylthiotransferase RimO [Candidatus Limiplasma sp.]|nr:30S ribosomal protein S12 methylthiotransferase RimO [Candidatus Limiplasma sp.]HPS81434.1 30S ribosomal protein S12 methylthiotransferase RimO [Candidatus Limiplasma sp.]